MTKAKAKRLSEAFVYLAGNLQCCDQPLRQNSAFGTAVEAVCMAVGITDRKQIEHCKNVAYSMGEAPPQ